MFVFDVSRMTPYYHTAWSYDYIHMLKTIIF